MDNQETCEKLNDLIKLDFDAIEAYQAAIERLEAAEYRQHLAEFMQDHERHTQNLSEQVRALGGTPAIKADAMAMLTKVKVLIGQIGEDRGILMAMKANEAVTNSAHEKALQKLDGHTATAEVVRQNLGDEQRHKAWIDATLDAMSG